MSTTQPDPSDTQDEESPMYTVLFAMYRKDGLSPEGFVAHYTVGHIPVVGAAGAVRA